jgi:hypothetical protein
MKTNKLKGSVFTLLILLFIGSIQSCHEDETSNEINEPITTNYNATILSYLASLKSEAGKENGTKIEVLNEAIKLNTIHIYDLKSTEKLLIADISSLKGFESYKSTKAIFFLLNNKIIHSKIVSVKYDDKIDKTNQLIISIFNKDKNKAYFTGTVSFYNMLQNMQLTSDYNNGILEKNSSVLPKSKKFNKSNSCTDWYWVTTYSNGSQDWSYAYTTCTCDYYKSACGGGGGGSSSSGSGGAINYPSQPNNNDLFTYIDTDGEMVTKKYNALTSTWELDSITLSQVVVITKPKYNFLLFYDGKWPIDNQKIVQYDLIYTFDIDTGSWQAVPNTSENIAKAIEEQIDDSKLDPCTKAIMEKLKNATHSDIAKMLSRFAPAGSIFNINMSVGQVKDNGNWAETKKTTGSSTDVNMIFNENYINGVGNTNRPTDLSIASTMVHEMIHAYLISLLEENKTCGASGICDFHTIYDAYVQQQIDKGSNIVADEHHELIAKQYVFAIATTIQEFHTGQYTDYPYQNYLDMAWGGLQGTYIFNKNYPDDSTHKNYKARERIMARINAERKGSQYYGALPLGTPCKK